MIRIDQGFGACEGKRVDNDASSLRHSRQINKN